MSLLGAKTALDVKVTRKETSVCKFWTYIFSSFDCFFKLKKSTIDDKTFIDRLTDTLLTTLSKTPRFSNMYHGIWNLRKRLTKNIENSKNRQNYNRTNIAKKYTTKDNVIIKYELIVSGLKDCTPLYLLLALSLELGLRFTPLHADSGMFIFCRGISSLICVYYSFCQKHYFLIIRTFILIIITSVCLERW